MSSEIELDPESELYDRPEEFTPLAEIDPERYDAVLVRLSSEVKRLSENLLRLVSGVGLRYVYRRWFDASHHLLPRDRHPVSLRSIPPGYKEASLSVERVKGEWICRLSVRAPTSDVRLTPEGTQIELEEQIFFVEQSGLEQLIYWSQLARPFLSAYRAHVARAIEMASEAAERLEVVNEEFFEHQK